MHAESIGEDAPAVQLTNVTFPLVSVINNGTGKSVAGWHQEYAGTCCPPALWTLTDASHV